MCRRISLFCVCLFLLLSGWSGGNTLQAQNLQDEFDDYLATITGQFYTYLDSIDLAFARLLEDEWQEFTVYEGTDVPLYSRSHLHTDNEATPVFSATQEKAAGASSFYGQSITLPVMQPPAIAIGSLSEKEAANAWRMLFRHDFTTLLAGVNRYCRSLSLNDWGKYLLLRFVVDTHFPVGTANGQTLLLSYLLLHTGFDVKMAFAGQGLVLLLPVKEEVYQLPFIRLGDVKYYLPGVQPGGVKKLLTSVHAYPGEVHPVSLELSGPLAFAYDKPLIDLYATWPLCDLSVYFRARPARSFRQKADALLKDELAGKSPIEQVSFLLRWVQQSVTHIPDMDRHGREVYYFPEETLYHRYADCEDLSVLLHWLICTYTSCRTATLFYAGHVAVAIEAPAGYAGTVLLHQDKAYIICDPSYKGAPMGEVVPANKSLHPTVVSYH